MSPTETHTDEHTSRYVSKHRFIVFITSAIFVAMLLVLVSMSLYASSGAAQLDLSRPGYSSVRAQATEDTQTTVPAFSSTGPIDDQTLSDFRERYDKAAKQATSISVFGDDALSDASLQISPDRAQAR